MITSAFSHGASLNFRCLRVTGMAFGTGSAVAHRAVDAVMGPRTIQHETVVSEAAASAPASGTNSFASADACGIHSKAFQDVRDFFFLLINYLQIIYYNTLFFCVVLPLKRKLPFDGV